MWITQSTLFAGHPFCRECLARWQATSQLCPVCRTDQRTLERNNGQPNQLPRTDEPEDAEGPSLATILGLLGQLALRGGEPGLSAAHSRSDAQDGNGISFHWSSQPSPETASAAPSQDSSAAVSDLQSSIQFVVARIQSLDHRPLYWNAQVSELQQASAQLDACWHGTIANPAQVIQQVQQYTDTVNAQLDEFLTQLEAREQQHQRAQTHQHYSGSNQPSALPFASSPPPSSTATGSVRNVSSNASSSGGWSWKWGWGPAPAGTLPAEAPASTTTTEAQQASGIGAGTAAAAAAALTTVGAAAAAAYRCMTATASSDANTAGSSGSASQAQHQSAAGSSYSSQGQPGGSGVAAGRAAGRAAAPTPTSSAAAAGPPVQGIYDAVRNIFDQHVSSDSSLGRWGEVARHLNELHGQMNAGDSQSQDARRLLASAVNAYSAYRRATASSSNP